MYEQLRFLIKNSTKITTARISVKEGDQTTWHSLFTSTLEGIIEKYNEDNNEADTIEEIDEDKLCEVILTTKGIKLRVNSTNTVLGISFAWFHCIFEYISLSDIDIRHSYVYFNLVYCFIKLEILSNPNFVYALVLWLAINTSKNVNQSEDTVPTRSLLS